MSTNPILSVRPVGFPWDTVDPFLFCVHHDDAYPAGNERMGPEASLAGRSSTRAAPKRPRISCVIVLP